jgi:hypothetical protein
MDYPYLILHYFLIVETGFCFVFMKLCVEVLGGGGTHTSEMKQGIYSYFDVLFFVLCNIFLI